MSAVNLSWSTVVRKPSANETKSSKTPVSNPQITGIARKHINKEEEKTPLKPLDSSQRNPGLEEIESRFVAIQTLLEKGDTDSIVAQQLGDLVNQCVKDLNAIPEKFRDPLYWKACLKIDHLAQQMLEIFSCEYFKKDDEWMVSRQALDSSDHATDIVPFFREAMQELPLEIIGNKAWIFGKEGNKVRVSISGRLWLMTRNQLCEFAKTKTLWEKAFCKNEVIFTSLLTRPTTTQVLHKIASYYVQSCRIFGENKYITHFTNFNKTRGDFSKLLVELLRTRPQSEDRKKLLDTILSFFPQSISPKMYDNLLILCENKEEISEQDGANIIFSEKTTREQAISMAIATVFCGELRLVLDYCRELAILSPEERACLPKTLGERLQIVGFKKNKQTEKIEQIAICLKCHQMWPIYEAFYYAFRKTGLDLNAIEKLKTTPSL